MLDRLKYLLDMVQRNPFELVDCATDTALVSLAWYLWFWAGTYFWWGFNGLVKSEINHIWATNQVGFVLAAIALGVLCLLDEENRPSRWVF